MGKGNCEQNTKFCFLFCNNRKSLSYNSCFLKWLGGDFSNLSTERVHLHRNAVMRGRVVGGGGSLLHGDPVMVSQGVSEGHVKGVGSGRRQVVNSLQSSVHISICGHQTQENDSHIQYLGNVSHCTYIHTCIVLAILFKTNLHVHP